MNYKGLPIVFLGEYSGNQLLYLHRGQLALVVHPNSLKREWWYRCPCGSGGILGGHTVHSTDPVSITPSIVCPGGCHYFIRNGVIV